ncbi:hypothetical protein EVAR_9695_1 [Eumeta japonica]|uniref:Uncharacterized protein n=1 Tax=Eumeta variegata TaxID=151549 RepID=A0A4C1YBX6_EUMVA|nr:hypothetical protein EVAR_9695_1 [Eumeta japonica]
MIETINRYWLYREGGRYYDGRCVSLKLQRDPHCKRDVELYKYKNCLLARLGQQKANITRCSQAVTHPSTDRARRCLTSVIGREPVYSACKKPTSRGVPRRSPIQVLTAPDAA